MSNLLNGIAGILVAVAPNYSSLLVLRTLYGFGVKGGWVAGYVWSKGRTFNLTAGIHSPTKLKKHTSNILRLVSQSQRSWGWSTDARWESSTRCSSASASSSSLYSPTTSQTGAGCRSSSPCHTSSSCPTTGEEQLVMLLLCASHRR